MVTDNIVRGMGWNEDYVDGENLQQLLDYGTEELQPQEELDAHYGQPDWHVEYETERFKLMHFDDLTLYLVLDEGGNPDFGILQYP